MVVLHDPSSADPPTPRAPPRTVATQAVRLLLADLKRTFRRRVAGNPARLGVLAESWRTKGQLAAIHVAADFDVVDGSNRCDVAEANGDADILAVVHADIVTPEEKLAAFLAMENGKSSRAVQDVAFPVDALRRELGLTWESAGRAFGISPATASRYKRVTEAPEDVLAALAAGAIGLTELVEVMRHPPEQQSGVLRQAVAGGLDAKAIRAIGRPARGGRRKPVTLAFGGVRVDVPADMCPNAAIELCRTRLFAALSKAAALNLGMASVPRIIEGQGR